MEANYFNGVEPLPTLSEKKRDKLVREIADAINRVSAENCSNTPDFILAEYAVKCLENFAAISRRREQWYGKELIIGGSK